MGKLLDNGAITFQDLGFAADRAYNKRVRDAARTLLLHSLSQEQITDSTAGPLRVVSSNRRSYAESRKIKMAALMGLFVGVTLTTMVALFMFDVQRRNALRGTREPVVLDVQTEIIVTVIVIAGMVIIGLILGYIINIIMDWFDAQIRLSYRGQRGEERVVNTLYHLLDEDWHLFRNLEVPGQRGDIDFLLIGPNGVFTVEVKAYSGQYRNIGEKWERQLGPQWLDTFSNPSKQAKRNAARLAGILRNQDVQQWITPIVVWANPESSVTVTSPTVAVWQLDEIGSRLTEIQPNYPLPPERVEQIVQVFVPFSQKPDEK